jgi:hypothetical protein
MAVHSVPSWTECGIAEGQSLGDGRMTVPARRLETRLRDERERDVDPELSPGAARIVFLRRESPLARIGARAACDGGGDTPSVIAALGDSLESQCAVAQHHGGEEQLTPLLRGPRCVTRSAKCARPTRWLP